MILKPTRFDPEHAEHILANIQQGQAKDGAMSIWNGVAWEKVAKQIFSYSFVDADLTPIAAFGFIEAWPGRGMAWSLLSNRVGRKEMLYIHRKAVLAAHTAMNPLTPLNFRRLETAVRTDFPEAVRWIELLGFTREGLMRAYDAAGDDYYLYSRIRP